MKKTNAIIIFIILLYVAAGIYFYPQMPDNFASHWNARGQVDGYMSKFWGMFLLPIISLVMFVFFLIIPKIDPLKANIEKFRKYFDWFILLIILFLFYLYILTIVWNLGFRFNFAQFLVPAFGLLFYYVGILIKNAKRNWFIGIRTPWTLSSEEVWDKTHKLGGKLFKISGVITLLGIFFADYAIYFALVPIMLVCAYLVLYSYFEHRKVAR